jgi:hypothetical protein
MALLNPRPRPRPQLGWGIPDFIKEGLNPIEHIKTVTGVFTHPVDTFKRETAKAAGFGLQVMQPLVGGPGGVTPQSAAAAVSQAAQGLTQSAPLAECGFFDRLIRVFGGHPSCR